MRRYTRTPAMAAGIEPRLRRTEWIVDLVNERALKPNRPKRYRKCTKVS